MWFGVLNGRQAYPDLSKCFLLFVYVLFENTKSPGNKMCYRIYKDGSGTYVSCLDKNENTF